MLLAIASRFVNLRHGLPDVLGADDHIVLQRAQRLARFELPEDHDWPTGSMLPLAGWLRLTGRTDAVEPYAVARVLFAGIASAQVLTVGVLAGAARPPRRLVVASLAMLATVVAYPALRLGRLLHPDPLQCVWISLALVASIRVAREPRLRWVALAGAAAGLAAGTKYLGGTVVVSLVAAVLWSPGLGRLDRLRRLAVGAAAAIAAFVVAVPATVANPSDVVDGLDYQLFHQAGGHGGYDGDGPSFWWHLTTALPGSWGWAFTIVSLAGAAYVVVRGTTAQRIVAVHLAVGFVVVAWGVVRFPHYVLVYLPSLAVLGALAVDDLLGRVRAVGALRAALYGGAAIVLFGIPAAHGVRLLRAEAARDTRVVAAEVAADVEGRLVKEQYTDSSDIGDLVPRLALLPELVTCGCTVEISSYNEERYRAEPDRFAGELAVYDALRAAGRVVAEIRPSRPSSYRWDVLPLWGLDRIPLTGPVGLVGPTITFLELPAG